jgi:hypothetical protein
MCVEAAGTATIAKVLDEAAGDAVIRPIVRPVVRFVKTVVVKVVQLIVATVRRWWFNFVNRVRVASSSAQPVPA